ncbi:MAG: 16S rRNA (cytosine(1402)-N(4))-methyltransferase RsmH [Pseudomonadota bacterium]
MSNPGHQAVLLEEAVEAVLGPTDGVYVDCTYGRGGHSERLLGRLGSSASLLALDRDGAAEAHAAQLAQRDPRFRFVRANFATLESVLREHGLCGQVNGMLMDLGVSSPQLDEAERGFSFRQDGPLDMRMDTSQAVTAAAWLASADEQDIADALYLYGEERKSRRIARRICEARDRAPIRTTAELARLVSGVVGRGDGKKHPATRTFQAIRMVVNGELDALRDGLQAAESCLPAGGTLAVISFHSLEDRLVKRFFRPAPEHDVPRGLPVETRPAAWRVRGKPVRAGASELSGNARSRSAILRVAERAA